MSDQRRFSAIFCDDIRHEVNGKTTLVGCYSGSMYVTDFPIVLSKLCINAQLVTPKSNPFDGVVSISVLKDGEVIAKNDLDGAQLMQFADDLSQNDKFATEVFITTGLEFSPMTFDAPGEIKIFAETNDGVFYGGRLRVARQHSAQTGAN